MLGGNGQVGSAAARALRADGWDVVVTGRAEERFPDDLRAAGVRFVRSDRHDPADLRHALAGGADAVVDCVAYTAAHARLLLPLREDLGSVVLISSKAVYVDAHGRHSNSDEPPAFGGPVTEDQPTMAPSDVDHRSREGYGANKVAAERALLDAGLPVSVLRPSRVHGAGAARPREWAFVKRVLDGRRHLLLARGGRGANHPTAAANLGALAAFCAARPGARVLNCADPDAPDGLAIARTVAARLGHDWREVLLDDDAPEGLGDHPWNSWPPFLLDTSAAERLGFRPVGTYAETAGPVLDRLAAVREEPADAGYFAPYLDYAREDAWLADAAGRP
ncbi:MAG: NAD-dependent epimerase/dehydratase family protein [Nocardioides sp.]